MVIDLKYNIKELKWYIKINDDDEKFSIPIIANKISWTITMQLTIWQTKDKKRIEIGNIQYHRSFYNYYTIDNKKYGCRVSLIDLMY